MKGKKLVVKSSNVKLPANKSIGEFPSTAHQFKKGESGNPSGRPKLIGIAYKELLAQVNPATGKTHAQEIAEAQARAAKMSMLPHSVSAAKEIRQATEGGDEKITFNFYDTDMANHLARLADKKEVIEGEFEKLEEK